MFVCFFLNCTFTIFFSELVDVKDFSETFHFISDPLFRCLIGVVSRTRRSPHEDQDSCEYFSFMFFHLCSPVKAIKIPPFFFNPDNIQYLGNHVLYYHSVIICSGLRNNMIRNLSAQVFAYMNNLEKLYVIVLKSAY